MILFSIEEHHVTLVTNRISCEARTPYYVGSVRLKSNLMVAVMFEGRLNDGQHETGELSTAN